MHPNDPNDSAYNKYTNGLRTAMNAPYHPSLCCLPLANSLHCGAVYDPECVASRIPSFDSAPDGVSSVSAPTDPFSRVGSSPKGNKCRFPDLRRCLCVDTNTRSCLTYYGFTNAPPRRRPPTT